MVNAWNSKRPSSFFSWSVGHQLDDSKSLYGKWLEITKHPLKTGWPWSSRCIWKIPHIQQNPMGLRFRFPFLMPKNDCLPAFLDTLIRDSWTKTMGKHTFSHTRRVYEFINDGNFQVLTLKKCLRRVKVMTLWDTNSPFTSVTDSVFKSCCHTCHTIPPPSKTHQNLGITSSCW